MFYKPGFIAGLIFYGRTMQEITMKLLYRTASDEEFRLLMKNLQSDGFHPEAQHALIEHYKGGANYQMEIFVPQDELPNAKRFIQKHCEQSSQTVDKNIKKFRKDLILSFIIALIATSPLILVFDEITENYLGITLFSWIAILIILSNRKKTDKTARK